MKTITLTTENYNVVQHYIDISDNDIDLLYAILIDLEDNNNNVFPKAMEICLNIEHTQYSPEWVEPMPDFYGMFCIKYVDNNADIIGDWIADVHELDNIMFVLYEAFFQANV